MENNNNFNFNDFLKNQNQINNQLILSNQNMGTAMKSLKEQAIDSMVKQIDDMKNKNNKMQNDIYILKKQHEESKEVSNNMIQEINEIKEKTNVLNNDRAKARELTKSVKARVFKFAGKPNSAKYILFYRYYINNCYGKLKDIFEVASYRDIKIDDFEIALKVVNNWYPPTNMTNKKLHEYINDNDKKLLPEYKVNALNQYLIEINGGISA